MADPFEVLGVSKHAGEGEIRQRYLELVRTFPPERAPERFAAVHAAYQQLRDPAARLAAQLFEFADEDDSLETLAVDLRQRLRNVRLPVQTLLSLADSS
jgi:curved DNA-binding protein CbpA